MERLCLYRDNFEEIKINLTSEPNIFNLFLFRVRISGALSPPLICAWGFFIIFTNLLGNFYLHMHPIISGQQYRDYKSSANTVIAIKYYSFTTFILRHCFLIISCERFLSGSGFIPCSVVHQPYLSYNAAVKL